MKRLLTLFFICIAIFAQNAKAEEIRLDTIPVLEVNPNSAPKIITTDATKYDTFIEPAQEAKPSLNFNLNNIKNIKKGAILPPENQNHTVADVYQYFNAPYDKVFSHLVSIVDNSELEIVSYDTKSGKIFANYRHEKPVYITVSQYNDTNILVKIAPADGVFDLPADIYRRIFGELNRSLAAQ